MTPEMARRHLLSYLIGEQRRPESYGSCLINRRIGQRSKDTGDAESESRSRQGDLYTKNAAPEPRPRELRLRCRFRPHSEVVARREALLATCRIIPAAEWPRMWLIFRWQRFGTRGLQDAGVER